MNPSAHHAQSMKRRKWGGCRNYRAASLTLVPGKITNQILLKATSRPMRDKVTGNSHHWSASPIWLPSVMSPMDVGRAVVVHPDLQQKHAYRVDGQPTTEVKNGVDCCPQTLVANDLKSRRWPAARGWYWRQYWFMSYPPGWCESAPSSTLQMMPNWMMGGGWEQDNPKHGRGLPFSWILTEWSDVLMENLLTSSVLHLRNNKSRG